MFLPGGAPWGHAGGRQRIPSPRATPGVLLGDGTVAGSRRHPQGGAWTAPPLIRAWCRCPAHG